MLRGRKGENALALGCIPNNPEDFFTTLDPTIINQSLGVAVEGAPLNNVKAIGGDILKDPDRLTKIKKRERLYYWKIYKQLGDESAHKQYLSLTHELKNIGEI